MAHELTLRADGRAEMAFADYSGTPWHGLGQTVTKGASIGVWLKEAGMDWEAKEAVPVVPVLDAKERKVAELDFEDYKALYRSDTLAPLAIVGEGYNVVQPREVLEFFRDMTEEGGWHIHTAGTLRGGRKLWAMASRGEWGFVKGNGRGAKGKQHADEVHNNLLFATSLDGSMKTTVADTTVSVVCANTMAAALRDAEGSGRVITVSHRSVFDSAAVKRVLGLAGDTFERFMRQAQDLADTPCDVATARVILDRVFGVEPPKVDTSWMGKLVDLGKQPPIPDESRVVGAVLDLFEGAGMGADLPSRQGTCWGLLNAVTEHVDHGMGRTDDTRLDGAWFGRGASFKAKALELLTNTGE